MTDLDSAIAQIRQDGRQRDVRCPAHEDHRASLSVGLGADGRILINCQAGCSYLSVLRAAAIQPKELMPPTSQRSTVKTSKAKIVTTYDYTDESGTLLYQVCRMEPKDFRQRRPDGLGGWTWKIRDVRRVLYRLPDLLSQRIVVIVEGEKDADRLHELGYSSTTNAGGAGKWNDEYAKWLYASGTRLVAVIPDNDIPGRSHADAVVASCRLAGLAAALVRLPDVPPKGDVSDYLKVHDKSELDRALTAALAEQVEGRTSSAESPAVVLAKVETFVRRFVVLDDAQAVAVALWVFLTHAIEAFDCVAYLQVKSTMKRSGKTRLLEVLELLVARAWLTGRTSAAALVRKVDAEAPTLLLDESDAAFGGEKEYAEALRGILNSGFRRSGRATLCIGQGGNLTFRDFATFCPKAIAGIGELPGTVADRAIPIDLKRKTGDEPADRFRERDARQHATPLRDAIASWAKSAVSDLRQARPQLPSSLNDRAQDVWEPLLAIADAAGGSWPARARRSAVGLMGGVTDDDVKIELLADIRDIFVDTTFMTTTILVQKLVAFEDRPWATWSKGKPITGHKLARLLKPFGIIPLQNAERTARGYHADRFADAFSRYLPLKVSEVSEPAQNGLDLAFSEVSSDPLPDNLKNNENANNDGLKDGSDTLKPVCEDRTTDGEAGDASRY